jgi:hypothetical protein
MPLFLHLYLVSPYPLGEKKCAGHKWNFLFDYVFPEGVCIGRVRRILAFSEPWGDVLMIAQLRTRQRPLEAEIGEAAIGPGSALTLPTLK